MDEGVGRGVRRKTRRRALSGVYVGVEYGAT